MRRIYYSLSSHPNPKRDPQYHAQLLRSIESVRRHNATIPIDVVHYGSANLEERLLAMGVQVHWRPPYAEYLRAKTPRLADALSRYGIPHKWLSLAEINLTGATQVLYLDCDTYFFDDPNRLFERYGDEDVIAREEPYSRRSHYGLDPAHIDEELLDRLVAQEGLSPVAPFNDGVVLLNHGAWHKMISLLGEFLDYVWRCLVWIQRHPEVTRIPQPLSAAIAAAATDEDRARELPYPSTNYWILNEVAMWLTLGTVPGLRLGCLQRADVLLNGEFEERRLDRCDWILCHYLTVLDSQFTAWLAER